jgi:DNA-binding beta-propeller fold protein YncE
MLVFRRYVIPAVLLSLLSACASVTPPSTLVKDPQSGLLLRSAVDGGKPASARVWPAAPEKPRYRYVGQLLGEQNFDPVKRSWWQRALHWLAGLNSRKHQPRVLQRPQNGFVADDGRIFVTDVSRGAVYVFDGHAQSGRKGLQIWDYVDETTRFRTPLGIVADGHNGILVADAGLGCIFHLDSDGKGQGRICDKTLLRPTGMARDAKRGLLFVADSKAHDIKVFNDDGELVRTLGRHGEADGEFNGPTYLSIAGDRLYVSDTLNARIQVVDEQGHFLKSYGRRGLYLGDTPRPKGVATDRDGNVYIVESYYDYLLIFNDKGDFLLPIGGTGNAIGRFYLPAGVWIRDDRVYVADTFNGRVMIFQYLGNT